MNHRTRLTKIDEAEYAAARDGLSHLQRDPRYREMITVLEQELVVERELYETQEASEFQRGQVVMLKKVIAFLNGETLDD